MLVKLLPDQVSRQWEVISYAIEGALPPFVREANPEVMNNILMALMNGSLVCWAVMDTSNGIEEPRLVGIVTTMITFDPISRVKNLFPYTVYGYEGMSRDIWIDGIKTLSKYGLASGCKSIIGYTIIPSIVTFVKRVGGEAEFTFISIPLC